VGTEQRLRNTDWLAVMFGAPESYSRVFGLAHRTLDRQASQSGRDRIPFFG
jgi:hypothetical protein